MVKAQNEIKAVIKLNLENGRLVIPPKDKK
jgi:hypothetical protein